MRPFAALTPKDETQAAAFLAAHPGADGRGVIVAILDTGVDPGAAGLAVCPDGGRKVVDLVECSGSGDVDMRTRTTPRADGTLAGLTGRSLRPNPGWVNPTGEFRVGLKRAFELFPKPLVGRIKAERSAEAADTTRRLLSEAMAAQVALAAAHPHLRDGTLEAAVGEELTKRVAMLRDGVLVRCGARGGVVTCGEGRNGGTQGSEPWQATWVLRLPSRPLRVAPPHCRFLLQPAEDLGPVYDVVAWHDGSVWRGAIDAAGTGNLTSAVGFTDYRREGQWGVLDASTLLSYALNFYEDGNVMSIVTDAGAWWRRKRRGVGVCCWC